MVGLILALALGPALADEAVQRDALQAELERSMAALQLPDESPPWYVSYDLVDGTFSTAFAEFGALLQDDLDPHRQLRVEVRTGDPVFDSANFEAFGEPDGVVLVGMPHEDVALAIQRYARLATDRAYKQAVEQLSRKQAALAQVRDQAPTGP